MATRRTLTYLRDTMFADGQADGEIDEQDMRDFVQSLQASCAKMNLGSAGVLTINSAGVFEPIGGAGGISLTSRCGAWVESSNGVMQFQWAPDRDVMLIASCSLAPQSGQDALAMRFTHNGVSVGESEMRTVAAASSGLRNITCSWVQEIQQNDTVSVEIANRDSNTDLDITAFALASVGPFGIS